jgi:UDP-N-acetylmuramoyl-tripeptide--D-alanyl-D-alanine ligase
MKPTVLHVIPGLSAGKPAGMLKRLALADQGPDASRHVIVSLANDGADRDALQTAGVELHCLGLATLLRGPGALIRLIVLMRRIRPNAVVSWLNRAHLLTTFAAITSGVGTHRLIWNLSGSSPSASGRGSGVMLMLLARLSRLPPVIAVGSRSGMHAYKALGYRPHRWFLSYNSARESETERVLNSYRQLWRFASDVSDRRRFGAQFRRSWQSRFGPAYRWLQEWRARLRRSRRTKTTFIGVTGSCGKTTTVRLAVDMLTTGGSCYRGGFGNIPWSTVRTLLSVPVSAKYCIQETSAHRPSAIAKHVRVLRPEIGIVTTVGTDHYKSFRGLEATAREKGQLIEALPRNGVAILNADDPHVRAMAARTRARVLLFGLSFDADIRATEVASAWPGRLALTVVHGNESVRINTKLVGEHWITSVLAAVACGVVCGIDLQTCAQVVGRSDPVFGRYSIHTSPNGMAYVLDTHKAPFWTIAAGLDFLARARAARKTAIFGTISDYPGARGPKYRKIARNALQVADRVVFVGPNANSVAKLLKQDELQDRLFVFETSYQASAFIAKDALQEELIYIKASLSSDHLERLMLSQLEQVVCWRERCKREAECCLCRDYRKPHAPPFGVAESNSPVAARLR